jgi:hypothetical protein
MNRFWHFYDKNTGLFTGCIFSAPPDVTKETLEANTPAGHGAHEHAGHINHHCQRLDLVTGKVISYEPTAPSLDHIWDSDARRWQLSADAKEKVARVGAIEAQLAALERGSSTLVREAQLGKPFAQERLEALDTLIRNLTKELEELQCLTPGSLPT